MKTIYIILLLSLFLLTLISIDSILNQSIVSDEYIYFISAQLSCKNPFFPLSIYEKHLWFYDHPLVGQYIYSLSCIIPNINFSRMISILFGISSVFLLFLIGRQLFNEKIGLISSLFYGFSIPTLAYFRLAILDAFLSFFILLSVYLFLTKKERHAWFFGGIAFGVKYSGLILIPIFLSWYFINKEFELRKSIKNIGIFVMAFLSTNSAAILMWDYISPNRGLFIKIPIILKTFIYQTYAQGTLNFTTVFNNILSYMNILYHQIGLTFFIVFTFSLYLIFNRKNKIGYFLILWILFTFLFAVKISVATRYLIPMLPAFFLLISYTIYELYNKTNTRIISFFILLILIINIFNNIISIHPYYLMFGFDKNTTNGALLYGQYTKEAIDFVNENSNLDEKIYWKTLTWHPAAFKPSKYNIILHRNVTTDITNADYIIVDLEYKLKHPNNETIRYIENNFILIKEFKIKNITMVWIYKN